MTLNNIALRVAENIGILASDGSTIVDGRVTQIGIKNKINDFYIEDLFPLFSDKFADDFMRTTYPLPTYTASGTVDATSTSTTLITTTDTFVNSMEGFYVQCPNSITSTLTFAKIITYISATEVILDTVIGDNWDGQTIYILGNEFTLTGDIADIKEVKRVQVKYKTTDKYFKPCERVDYTQSIEWGNELLSKYHPQWYLTTININDVPTRAVGLLPFPIDYQGKLQIMYIERPPRLGDADEPTLTVPGISEVLIKGVSAWALRLMLKFDSADRFTQDYNISKLALVSSYKPKNRSNPNTIRKSSYVDMMLRRVV